MPQPVPQSVPQPVSLSVLTSTLRNLCTLPHRPSATGTPTSTFRHIDPPLRCPPRRSDTSALCHICPPPTRLSAASAICHLNAHPDAHLDALQPRPSAITALLRLGPRCPTRRSPPDALGSAISTWPPRLGLGSALSARHLRLGPFGMALRLGLLGSAPSTRTSPSARSSKLGAVGLAPAARPSARRSRLGHPALPPRLGLLDSVLSAWCSRLGALGLAPSERSHWTGHLGPTSSDGPSSVRPSRHDLYETDS